MARLYMKLIEATDGMITIGAPIGMVFQGTAAQVTVLCEKITETMAEQGFKIEG